MDRINELDDPDMEDVTVIMISKVNPLPPMIMFFKKSILNKKELYQRGQALQIFNLKGEKVYILASATYVVTFFLMSD